MSGSRLVVATLKSCHVTYTLSPETAIAGLRASSEEGTYSDWVAKCSSFISVLFIKSMTDLSVTSFHVTYTLSPDAAISDRNAKWPFGLLSVLGLLKVDPLSELLVNRILLAPFTSLVYDVYTLSPDEAICGSV